MDRSSAAYTPFLRSNSNPIILTNQSEADHLDVEMHSIISDFLFVESEDELPILKGERQHLITQTSPYHSLSKRIVQAASNGIHYFLTSEKRFSTVPLVNLPFKFDANSMREVLNRAFPNSQIVVSEQNGKIAVDIDGSRVGLEELKHLVIREQMFVGIDEAQKMSLSELKEMLNGMASHHSRKERFFHSTVGHILGRIGSYLVGTEKRISVQDWSESKELTVKKLIVLVRRVFNPEAIAVSELHLSLLGKPSLSVTYKKNQNNLSKAELGNLTDQMIDDLKLAIVRFDQKNRHSTDSEGDRQKLIGRLRDAEELQLMLRDRIGKTGNLVEYLSLKQEAFLALARTLCFPTFCIVEAGKMVQRGWKQIKVWHLTEKLIIKMKESQEGPSGAFSSMNIEELRATVQLASKLPQLLKGERSEFVSRYQELTQTSLKKEIIETLYRADHGLLKRAVAGKDVEAMFCVIENGLFKSVKVSILDALYSNADLTLFQRERMIGGLFQHAHDFKSQERIIDYLIMHNERDFAESLVSQFLDQTKGQQTDSTARTNALLFAAKLSSDALLVKAFGIGIDSVNVSAKQIKPYLFLPYEEGRSLLSFAIEGGNAHFILGIDQAMRELYNQKREGSNQTYREEKREAVLSLITELGQTSKMGVSKPPDIYIHKPLGKLEIIAEHLEIWSTDHPELAYLNKCKEQPATLLRHLHRELYNIERTAFQARDPRGVSNLSRLDLGTADAMDNWLSEYMESGISVDCFRSAALYQQEVRSTRSAFVNGMYALGFFAGCCCVAALPFKITLMATALLNILDVNVSSVGRVGAQVGEKIQNTWWAKLAADNRFSRSLTQYLEKFPLDGLVGKEVESDTPQAIKSRQARLKGVFPKLKGNALELQKAIEVNLKHNNAADVLVLLQHIKELPLQEKEKMNWDRIVSLYADLTLYSKEERLEILTLLFDLVPAQDQLVDLIDTQLTLGRRGGVILEQFVNNKIFQWKRTYPEIDNINRTRDEKQYEVAMVIASKLGSLSLFDALMEIESLRNTLDWKNAGGTRTSLLHAAITSKLSGSNVQSAKLVHAIYKQMIETNSDPNFSPFHLLKGGSTWYNRWLKDRHVLELATVQQAAAFDAELGMDPSIAGTMTHAVIRRIEKSLLPIEVARMMDMVLPPLLIYGAAKCVHLLPHILGIAGSGLGPAGIFFCEVSAVLVMELAIFLTSFALSVKLGKNFGQAYHEALEKWSGLQELAQLGKSSGESVTALRKKEMTRLDFDVLTDKLQTRAFENVQLVLLKGVEDVKLAYSDDKTQRAMGELYKGISQSQDLNQIKLTLDLAEISPTVKFILLTGLMSSFEQPLGHFPSD